MACLAILADPNAGWRPNSYSSSFWETEISIRYPVVKLLDFADRLDELEHSSNPFARFVMAHLKTLETQGDYETRLQWKLRIIQGLYDMGVPDEEVGQLYHDFDWLLALPEQLSVRFHTTMNSFKWFRTPLELSAGIRNRSMRVQISLRTSKSRTSQSFPSPFTRKNRCRRYPMRIYNNYRRGRGEDGFWIGYFMSWITRRGSVLSPPSTLE